MAGIWETWTADKEGRDFAARDELPAFNIITTAANKKIAELHKRMPVILEPDMWDPWLSGTATDDVLTPLDAKRVSFYRVSRDVNNVRNDGAELIEPK